MRERRFKVRLEVPAGAGKPAPAEAALWGAVARRMADDVDRMILYPGLNAAVRRGLRKEIRKVRRRRMTRWNSLLLHYLSRALRTRRRAGGTGR